MSELYLYRIDRNDLIIFVSDNWLAFAEENEGADSCHPSRVLNKPLWDFISGEETRLLYQVILEKVRSLKSGVAIPYRCDSPAYRRFMEMEVLPLEDRSVEFRSRILRVEKRDPIGRLEKDGPCSDEFITMCSFCRKILVSKDEWLDAEKAVEILDLFGAAPPPQITHGVCPPCHCGVMAKLKEKL